MRPRRSFLAMIGTNANTGQALSGIALCEQQIRDVLTTPKGTRVMRRTYGSDVFSLTDLPWNQDTRMRMIAATADALDLWVPEIQVNTITFLMASTGQLLCNLAGYYLPDGTPIQINGIVIN
jgi:phage baseplate assembly protein W